MTEVDRPNAGVTVVKTRIVRIGKAHAVRIPQPLIEQTGLSGEVEVSVEDNTLIIKPVTKPRGGWAAAFRAMAERGDDALPDAGAPLTSWDEDEWEWQ
jgi:antitoxin MazE